MRAVALDTLLGLLLAAGSLLLGAEIFLPTPAHEKVVYLFGGRQAWLHHVTWWWLAAVPAVIAVALRRRWPPAAVILAGTAAAAHLLDPAIALTPANPLDLALPLAIYTLASTARSRGRSLLTLAIALAVLYAAALLVVLTGGLSAGEDQTKSTSAWSSPWPGSAVLAAAAAAVVPMLLLGTAWALGDSARTRRAHLATVQARAADAEREHAQRTTLAVAAERGRITRELHDVVAHGLAVMVIQAQAAEAALDRHPDRTRLALGELITTGRASLAEMRRLLGLVRATNGGDLAPQPTLGALPDLIDQVRGAGTAVRFSIAGHPSALPAAVELSAYRIVQEALTNTLKHAGPGARCHVSLAFTQDTVRIRVSDDGTAPATVQPGNGLRGITERVQALGGTLQLGRAASGGFEVTASLPIDVPA